MRHRSAEALLALALVAAPLVALAGDEDAAAAVRSAVRALLDGDRAARGDAERVLSENPEAAVPELVRLVRELRAERAGGGVTEAATVTATSGGAPVPRVAGEGDVVQIYDVRDLIRGRLTIALLASRVEAAGGDGTAASAQGDGVLVVVAPPAAHDAVREALNELRSRGRDAFAIGSHLLRAPAGATLGADLSALRPGTVVRLDDIAQRLARWQAAGDADIAAGPLVVTLGDEPASVTLGREVSFVEDMEVEFVEGSIIADPVVATIFDGVVAEFGTRPTAGGVCVALDATVTDLADEFDVVTTDLGALHEPVRIQRPSFVRTQVARLVTIEDGGSFVLRLPDDTDGSRRLLVVTARREPLPEER